MGKDAIEFREGGVAVRVTGLRDVQRKMNQAASAGEDMRDLMHSLGQIVIQAAQTPVLTGQLAATLRAGRGKTKAVVRAGYKTRAPYAGVVHYGWPARNIKAQPYLVDALRTSRSQVFAALEQGIDQILRKNKLK
jgi:phage gpG-like protein